MGNHSKYSGIFNYEDNISDQHMTWVKIKNIICQPANILRLKKKK